MVHLLENGNGFSIRFIFKDNEIWFAGLEFSRHICECSEGYVKSIVKTFVSDNDKHYHKSECDWQRVYVNKHGLQEIVNRTNIKNNVWKDIAWLFTDGYDMAMDIAKDEQEKQEEYLRNHPIKKLSKTSLTETFFNEGIGKIRTIISDGNIYFVAVDIIRALGYVDAHCYVTKRIHRDNKKIIDDITVINEAEAYFHIFKRKNEESVKLANYIIFDVIPALRKKYVVELNFPDVDKDITEMLKKTLAELDNKDEDSEKCIEQVVNDTNVFGYADITMEDLQNKYIEMKEFPKRCKKYGLNISLANLYKELRDRKIFDYSNNKPYEEYVLNGYFIIEQKVNYKGHKNGWKSVFVTEKGEKLLISIIDERLKRILKNDTDEISLTK